MKLITVIALALFTAICPAHDNEPTEGEKKVFLKPSASLEKYRQKVLQAYVRDVSNPEILFEVKNYNHTAWAAVKDSGGDQLYYEKDYGDETITIKDPTQAFTVRTVKKEDIKPIAIIDFDGSILGKGKNGKGAKGVIGIMPTLPPKNPLDRTPLFSPHPPVGITSTPPSATR